MTRLNSISARLRRASGLLLLCGGALLACGASARADDYFLRGAVSGPAVRWDGFSVGGTFGRSNMNTDFSNSTTHIVGRILQNTTLEEEEHVSRWPVLGNTNSNGSSWGGFVGYNWQLDDILVGVEGTYNRMSGLSAQTGPTTMTRVVGTSDGTSNNTTVTASSRLRMRDYAALRARVGYGIGQFMPYGFLGVAAGRFDYSTTAQVSLIQTDSGGTVSAFSPPAQTDSKSNAIAAGLVVGLGVDVAVLPNLFLRAEWEYAAFAAMGGIRPTVNTGRVGLALHF